jgi:hypothetical protein
MDGAKVGNCGRGEWRVEGGEWRVEGSMRPVSGFGNWVVACGLVAGGSTVAGAGHV